MIQIFCLQNLYSDNEETRAHLNERSHLASLLPVPRTVVQHYVGGPHLRLEMVIFSCPFFWHVFVLIFLASVLTSDVRVAGVNYKVMYVHESASVLVAYFLSWNPCVHDRFGAPALPCAHFSLCPKNSVSSYGKAGGCSLHTSITAHLVPWVGVPCINRH